ncbi:MAG TPA: hypothetical protein VK485_02710 [Sphingomicrobium sp.]|nr:hypothetical protein [Sphingomicrobium sp.]
MRKHLLAVGFAAAASTSLASAQPASPQPPANPVISASPAAPLIVSPPPGPPAQCCVLAKLTPVFLTIDEPVESDKAKIGQSFRLKLAQPLSLAGGVVIPAGTPGSGEVVHAAKSRAMGKPGELVLAARYLDYQGIRIPLRSLRYGKGQGTDNAETAMWVGIAVSAFITPFITGGEVRIPAGADVWAKTAADVSFPPLAPAQIVPAEVPTQVPTQNPTQGVN